MVIIAFGNLETLRCSHHFKVQALITPTKSLLLSLALYIRIQDEGLAMFPWFCHLYMSRTIQYRRPAEAAGVAQVRGARVPYIVPETFEHGHRPCPALKTSVLGPFSLHSPMPSWQKEKHRAQWVPYLNKAAECQWHLAWGTAWADKRLERSLGRGLHIHSERTMWTKSEAEPLSLRTSD